MGIGFNEGLDGAKCQCVYVSETLFVLSDMSCDFGFGVFGGLGIYRSGVSSGLVSGILKVHSHTHNRAFVCRHVWMQYRGMDGFSRLS